jgi:hypothetical protein
MSADRAAAVERVRQAKSAAVIGSVLLFGAVTGTVAVAQANTDTDSGTSNAVVDDRTTTDADSSFFDDDGDSGVTGSGGHTAVGGTNVS